MKLGIGSYTFPWSIGVSGYPQPKKPLDIIGLIEKAGALGVSVVQICDNIPLYKMESEELNRILGFANRLNVTIEVGTRGLEHENLSKYIGVAKKLNAKILRTTMENPGCKINLRKTAAQIERVLPQLEKEEVSIAIENYEQYTSKTLANLVKRLNSLHVGVCLDTVNSFGALEGFEEAVKRLAPFTLNLHIKDFDIKRVRSRMGFKVVGRPAGKGRLKIDWLLKVLGRYGRDPNVILELWTPFSESIEKTIFKEEKWAIMSIKYLRGKIRK